MEIKYSFPIPGVDDLQARLMLNDVAITEWETAIPYEISGIHAGYIVEFEDVDADAVQWASISQELADEKELPAPVDLGDMPEKIDYIYDQFTYIPPDRGAILLPAPTNPQMTKIAVFLVGGPAPRNGEEVTVTMYEKGNVYIDGWYQIKREFTGTSGTYTDKNNVVFEGVAVIDVYDSQKLEDNECNGLYQVVAKGLQRDLWVLPGGGDIGEMPTAKPEETE